MKHISERVYKSSIHACRMRVFGIGYMYVCSICAAHLLAHVSVTNAIDSTHTSADTVAQRYIMGIRARYARGRAQITQFHKYDFHHILI